jgi:hypothetical protein
VRRCAQLLAARYDGSSPGNTFISRRQESAAAEHLRHAIDGR